MARKVFVCLCSVQQISILFSELPGFQAREGKASDTRIPDSPAFARRIPSLRHPRRLAPIPRSPLGTGASHPTEIAMSSHYYDPSDAKARMQMAELAPSDFKAWIGLNMIPSSDTGAIPVKVRELIAIAVAHATGCPYCIEAHVKKGKAAGVTKQETAEAVLISAALCAGAAAAHGGLAMKFFDEAQG
jgi:AhpD family alkylhydroperoxidase